MPDDISTGEAGRPAGAPLAIAAMAALSVIGAFLPWGTGRVLFISRTVDGFDMDGEISLTAGLAVILGVAVHLAGRVKKLIFCLYSLFGGGVILGVCLYQWTKLETVIIEAGPFTIELEPEVNAEIGLILTFASGIGIIDVSLWQVARTARRAG